VKVIDPEVVSERRDRTVPPGLIARVPIEGGFETPEPVPFQVEQPPAPPEEATVREQSFRKPALPEAPPEPEAVVTPRWQLLAGAAVVVVIVAVVAVVLATGAGEPETASTTTVAPGGLIIVEVPDAPSEVAVTVGSSVAEVTWNAAGAVEGDQYQVTYRFGLEGEPIRETTGDTSLQIVGVPDGSDVCVEVLAIRNGRFSESTPIKCEGS
jgi:hypothetical protein